MAPRVTGRPGRGARLGRLTLLLVLALSAVGCGDSSDDQDEQSGTEAWATDVCSSALDWRSTVDVARDTLSDTSSLSADSARAAIEDVKTATTILVTELEDLGAPDTEAGDAAAEAVSSLAASVDQQQEVVSDATEAPASGVADLLAQVSTVTGAIGAVLADVSTTIDDIRGLDGGEELDTAFEDSSACQELRATR